MDELRERLLNTLTAGCDPRDMGPWEDARAEAEAMLAEYERALSKTVWDEGATSVFGIEPTASSLAIELEANPYRITEENN